MQRRWAVVRVKDGLVVGQFASRFAAMVFAERQIAEPHTIVDHVPLSDSRIVHRQSFSDS